MVEGDRIGGRFRLLRRQPGKNASDRPNEVWLAHDELMGRDVVLKRFTPGDPESRVLAGINHQHVITLYDCLQLGPEGDWLVMEYAPHGSLAEQPKHTPRQAARIGAQIAGALTDLHVGGVVHCDVKPANIVLAENGFAKLTDFGAANRYAGNETPTLTGPGVSHTPAYAAPEVVAGSPAPASDVYSLALTVYALVVGEPPHVPGHTEAGPAVLGPLAELLDAMRRPTPADRPGTAEVQRRFEAIANGADPAAAANPTIDGAPTTARAATAAQRSPVVPAQLPADVNGFAGRAAELDRLDALLATSADRPPPTAVVISAVSGTAGVGKTALAVHWAHRMAGRFPDGQLYVNLRGFDPSGQVLDPGNAVRSCLEALGATPEQIPDGLDAQTALYRSLLAGRRVLVVLDNARDSAQLRPLLPGAPGCLVIATSRNDLTSLVSREGAQLLPLDLLSAGDAHSLLEQRLGPDRVAAEPGAADELVQACASLPLALAIVAARAAIRPTFPLSALVTELRDSHDRFAALAAEGPDSDVRAVFSWSYEQLSAEAARLFRLLGLHPGPDFTAPAAASLAGVPRLRTNQLLAELTAANVLAEHAPGRYSFHDLLRAYATGLAHEHDTGAERRASQQRMLDHYVHTAHPAAMLLNPGQDDIELAPPAAGSTIEAIEDHRQAMSWYTAEHRTLLAAIDSASAAGFDTQVWALAWSVSNYLDRMARWQDRVDAWQAALAAAGRAGDQALQARAHRNLANAHTKLGRFEAARTSLEQALSVFSETGDIGGQAHTYRLLAVLHMRQEQYDQALEHALQALDHYDRIGHEVGRAGVLNDIGWYQVQLGEYQQAVESCERALALTEELAVDSTMAAAAWDTLGYAHHHLGNHPKAIQCYQQALELMEELVQLDDMAQILDHLGDAHDAAGDHEAARDAWQRSLAILEDLGQSTDTVRAKLSSS
ncbi:protein kinase domain-containing protein [Flindersiella endophytica]